MQVVSIGSTTHTRVDSAAKHIRQCKIHEKLMLRWLGSSKGQEDIHRQKNKFATMKDDLVLNVNESIHVGFAPADAYPSVVSNFTSLGDETKELIAEWYDKSTPPAFFGFQHDIKEKRAKYMDDFPQTHTIPFFRAQGYALGRAEASARSGDTVFSVLIGGMMTVTNGHFPMRPGQMVQWYFDFEANRFDKDGRRLRTPIEDPIPEGPLAKRAREEINAECTSYARPKPYVPSQNGTDHYGDKIRIFAKCIAGGAAFHKVDIMLMTQSL